MNTKEYFTRQELADKLGISKKVVEKWDGERRLPGRVKLGGLVKYSIVEVEKRLAGGCLLLPKRVKCCAA